MEVELSCSLCCQLLSEPLLLPCCYRAICSSCAKTPPQEEDVASDKASVYSETDSGVVVATSGALSSTRVNQAVGLAVPSPIIPPPAGYAEDSSSENTVKCPVPGCAIGASSVESNTVQCPSCKKSLNLGPGGLSSLPPYPAMSRILARFKGETGSGGSSDPYPPCQLCEGPPGDATISCVECKIQYCGPCLNSCHPLRGPLSTHNLVQVAPLASLKIPSVVLCGPHSEVGNVYCTLCGCVVCSLCEEQLHQQHDIQPLENLSKTYKGENFLSLVEPDGES